MNKQKQDVEEIVKEYIEEYSKDVNFDETRLREYELIIPGLKGKWSGYKAINKAKLNKLKRERESLLEHGVDAVYNQKKDAGDNVTKKGAEEILKRSKTFKEIDHKVDELYVLVELFESCELNMRQLGFDIKNLIDTIKLDEM
jgi:hypothetical protein